MKALVLEEQHKLTLRDFPIERDEVMGPHDVRIKMHTVGICGSDVHYYTHGGIGEFIVRAPMILGHEASGTVIEAGSAVKTLKVGDRVCMEPGIPDPNSRATRLGLYNIDPAVRFWATPPVHGILRPTVYLGDASIDVLESDELAAVLHHEDHHRRTLAPLRAAALEAWLRIVGRSAAARGLLSARLAQLEEAADAYAMQRGVHPGAIAAALLKVDPQRSSGTAFSGAGDRRIQALIDAAAGRPAARTTPLPYEWLPLVIVIAVTVGCHLGDVSPLL